MKQSEQLNELATALASFQAEVTNPQNTAKNPFLKNKYAPLNDVLNHVRPMLAKHGLSVSQLVSGEDSIGVTTMLLHKSGQYLADNVTLKPDNGKGLSVAQNAGVVITYLRRYGLTAILGIAGEDDTDGGHGSDEPTKRPESKPELKPESGNMQNWRKAIGQQAKQAGCVNPQDFHQVMYAKFKDVLKFDEGQLVWESLNATTYNQAMQLFKDDWRAVLDDATLGKVADIFEDDIPI
jgi:hypothetical protein